MGIGSLSDDLAINPTWPDGAVRSDFGMRIGAMITSCRQLPFLFRVDRLG